jgi:hypothetical protein
MRLFKANHALRSTEDDAFAARLATIADRGKAPQSSNENEQPLSDQPQSPSAPEIAQ